MAVAAVARPNVHEIKGEKTPQPIRIDFEKIGEYAGLKLDDKIVCDWLRDKDGSVVEIEELMKTVDITKAVFLGEPRFELTFKTTIQYMVDSINEFIAKAKEPEVVPLVLPSKSTIHGEIYYGLANYSTPRPDLLSKPPQYGGRVCSASPSDLNCLDGAIIHMLYEQGHIAGYGRKGVQFWVEIK